MPTRVGGGRGGGKPPAPGASSGGRREPRAAASPRLASPQRAVGKGREGGGSGRGSRRRRRRSSARSEAEEPLGLPSAACGGRRLRAPHPAPPKIPLLKEPRGPARLKPVAAPWQEEPLTLPETHTRGEAAAGGRAPPIATSHTAGRRRDDQSARRFYGTRVGRAARRGVGWRRAI